MFILHVTYTARPGQREAFVAAVAEAGIDAASRSEEGCVRYDYFYPAQGGSDDVLLLELWDTVEAQQKHTQTAHFKALGAIKEQYVANTTIQKYTGE